MPTKLPPTLVVETDDRHQDAVADAVLEAFERETGGGPVSRVTVGVTPPYDLVVAPGALAECGRVAAPASGASRS